VLAEQVVVVEIVMLLVAVARLEQVVPAIACGDVSQVLLLVKVVLLVVAMVVGVVPLVVAVEVIMVVEVQERY
jgi:hypothetical protein